MKPWGLHWFRRDLRWRANPAFLESCRRHHGRVLGLFIFDAGFLKRPDFSHNRFAFFLNSLRELKSELRDLGGELLVIDAAPREGFARVLEQLKCKPELVTWNRDYEPFARARDKSIAELLESQGIAHRTERDHLIFEPEEIVKDDGGFYQIYSAFARRWFERLHAEPERLRLSTQKPKLTLKWGEVRGRDFPFSDVLPDFIHENQRHVDVPLPDAGTMPAQRLVQNFGRQNLHAYHDQRDFPALDATSHLGAYLKNGSLTAAQLMAQLHLENQSLHGRTGAATFTKQIVWREFFYHILWHRPEVEKQSFNPRYVDLDWPGKPAWLARWKEGQTGFPIVDAGMRELSQTGYMHNRVRMIVASFLTKDLLLDWRLGEKHFMHKLLDGDLAANNGSWQWAASTGCDPQPYFRVFNPWLQSKEFDAKGDYIRRFVPELAEIDPRALHKPDGERGGRYPAPMVAHEQQRARAISLYKRA